MGNAVLAHGWQTFARACGLGRRCTLHFKYDGVATLYVRVFGEDGRRAGCCPEDSGGDDELGLDGGRDDAEGGLALDDGRDLSSWAAPPPAKAPAVVATTNRHIAGLTTRTMAGCPTAVPR